MNKLTAKDFKRGIRVVKSQLTDFDNYPVYQNSLKPLGFYSKYNVKANTVFVICAGAAGDIGFSNKNFWAADDCYYLETDKYVDSKFIYYYLLSIQNDIKRQVRQASVPRLGSDVLKSITLPSVSDNKQQEIVKILDSFTNLIDALNEELSLRQKQFEYYREKLLTFDESHCVKISSICKRIVSGGTPKTTIDRYYQGNIPWLRTEEVDFCYVYETKKHISEEAIANSSTKMIPVNCVIIAMYGATAAKCCINKIPLCTNQACCNLEIDDTLALYKFVFFNICKEYEKLKSLGEGSQNNISGQKIKDYRIPIPSLAIQQSIVEKLDAFESLISSLKEEIALRQKQYEYYREKLLTFD